MDFEITFLGHEIDFCCDNITGGRSATMTDPAEGIEFTYTASTKNANGERIDITDEINKTGLYEYFCDELYDLLEESRWQMIE